MQVKESNFKLLDVFLDYILFNRALSQNTIDAYRCDLSQFLIFLDQYCVEKIDAKMIADFLKDRDQNDYRVQSQIRMCVSIKQFVLFLKKKGFLMNDVENLFKPLRPEKTLPTVLSEIQIEQLFQVSDLSTPLGMRDQMVLELMYGSGLRVSELVALKIYQMNLKQGTIRLLGKGKKERMVPISESCIQLSVQYLREARPILLSRAKSECVLISQQASTMTRQSIWYRIKKLAKMADIYEPISPHTLRHAFATHLLNHGADLRVLQMLLGHSSINTTEIYTHISTQKMKKSYHTHHPRGDKKI